MSQLDLRLFWKLNVGASSLSRELQLLNVVLSAATLAVGEWLQLRTNSNLAACKSTPPCVSFAEFGG